MKKPYKLALTTLAILALGLSTSCSSGPSICDCANAIQNPMNASHDLAEKCAKKFSDLSPREVQEKYQKECN